MSALETWRQRAIEEVTLPSGMQVRIRKPRSDQLLREGHLPSDLRQAVMKMYSGETKLEQLEPEVIETFLAEQDRQVAQMVVELRVDDADEWEAATLSADDLEAFPTDDIEALRDIGSRAKTSEAVTARSLMARQLLDRATALRREEEAKPASIPAWVGFRDERRGDEPGAAGEGVAPAAVADPAPRRARRRRGAGG